jgi:hypothetical protein
MRTSQTNWVITMPQNSPRNHRNNPYALDWAFAQMHHSAAGTIWRYRTELTALAAVIAVAWALATTVTAAWMVMILTALSIVILALPWTRRFVVQRAWCVLSRHRIQRVCYETRMHTRSGRLPLVLRITPTQVGERALIWCRAGICAEDFEAHAAEIAAACLARQARIEGSKRWGPAGPAGHRAPRHPRPALRDLLRARGPAPFREGRAVNTDPLLAALADAAQRKQQADRDLRLLLAYAREHTKPRPYRLADLADVAGMSISGVRVAYTGADIEQAARLTGGARSRHLVAVIASLLTGGRSAAKHHPAA